MDFDEHIDPLDPRFVDAVLARARRRAAAERAQADAAPTTPTDVAPAAAPPTESVPVVSTRVDDALPAVAAPVEQPPTISAPPVEQPATAEQPLVLDEPLALDESVPDALAGDDDDNGRENRRLRNLVEWIAVAVGAVVVAFLIRAFLLQAFYIPSESMEPTLYENDRILVNKLSYKLHDVNRGDLVVFEKPPNEPDNGIHDLIKRAIALPGETIELHPDGQILIDGQRLDEPYLADQQQPGQMTMLRDNFVEGACTNPVSEPTRCTLGDGFVWVMGDNRNHSHDSRAFGPIDEDLIVGRAFVKVWPLSDLGFL